jgi:hypothetical protein
MPDLHGFRIKEVVAMSSPVVLNAMYVILGASGHTGSIIANSHIPSNYVVKRVTVQRKPPEVRICRLRNQSRVGTVPPSTSTPQWPAC